MFNNPFSSAKKKVTKKGSPLITPKSVLNSPDRRISKRRLPKQKCTVEITSLTDSKYSSLPLNYKVNGTIIDVSPDGIGAIIESYILPGSLLNIKITGSGFTYEIATSVVWCNELPSTKKIMKKVSEEEKTSADTLPPKAYRLGLFLTRSKEEKNLLDAISKVL